MEKQKDNEGFEKQEGMQFWNPTEVGQELKGEVVAVNEGDYGKQYVVRTANGDEVTTSSHKVLQNLLVKAKVGSKVKIRMTGFEKPRKKGNNPTTLYEVWLK